MKKILKLLITAMLPLCVAAQVQIQKTNATNITTILPFYNSKIIENAVQQKFSITMPAQRANSNIAPSIVIDSTYDDLDDTTYEYSPILDYGTVLKANLNMDNGSWQQVPNGNLWVLKIFIENALNTSVHFENFSLSPTSTFYIANGDMTEIKGPYTKEAMLGISTFGTFPMDGNSCFLLLYEPRDANISLNSLTISGIVGGYQSIGGDGMPLPIINTPVPQGVSNKCVPSIKCYPQWASASRAVSRWSNGGGSACSGTLLNNENQNGIGYFYSAHHCLPSNIGNLANASFQFQYWQTSCNSGINMNWIEFYGATLLSDVGYNSGDEILLKLNSGPGVGDGPTYAGWSRQNANPMGRESGIIHHPESGDMRFTQTKRVRDFLWNKDFWKASYSSGIMRPGSSGSALMNEHQQVIGALSRGTSSCFWNFLGDRFGKFHKGWSLMGQYLSKDYGYNDIGSLALNALAISGNTGIGCTSEPQSYSVPNLIGCSYNWTVSNNFSIVGGLGTNRIWVSYNGNQQTDIGWVNLVINDSKGSFPNGRRVELQLGISKVSLTSVSGYYTINTDPTQYPLAGGGKFITAERGAQVSLDFNVTGISNATNLAWTCDNYSGTGNHFQIGFTAPQTGYTTLSKAIYLDAYTTSCGVVRNGYYFTIMSLGWSLKIATSPNPTTNTINLSISKILETNNGKPVTDNISSLPTANRNTKIFLYPVNSTIPIKAWSFSENTNTNYNLNTSGLLAGVYIITVERDGLSTSSKIVVF